MDAETLKTLGKVRIELGQRIERENDADGDRLSDAESQAILLAAMDDRGEVPEAEIMAIFAEFLKAKRTWLSLRTSLALGGAAIRMAEGGLVFSLGEVGRELVRQNPHLFPTPPAR